jgi:hypothetical protein
MTPDASAPGTCPRCGANAGGAPWCPSCGLNLRLHAPETPPPEAPAPETAAPPSPPPPMSAPAPPRSNPSRRHLVAMIAGVLALGGAIAAVAILAFGSSSPRSAAAAKTVVKTVSDTVVVTDDNAGTPPQVTVDEMHNVLLEYVQAYSDESVGELESLFAPDLVRRNGDDPIEHRDAALATYQQQFDQLTNPQYQLSGLQYQSVPGGGTAEGSYVITSSAGQSQGRIGFVFEVRDGLLLINGIRVIPS